MWDSAYTFLHVGVHSLYKSLWVNVRVGKNYFPPHACLFDIRGLCRLCLHRLERPFASTGSQQARQC